MIAKALHNSAPAFNRSPVVAVKAAIVASAILRSSHIFSAQTISHENNPEAKGVANKITSLS